VEGGGVILGGGDEFAKTLLLGDNELGWGKIL